ncbi:subclass B1 metallo-beta-lactamase [Aquimarina mytili]|uniref:beta-lactamase n=1 Tax=Aquimarina mytili TaxID=874423 RepID=A0A937D4U9_9FLAO|nr:subclass B1 metallo-beta-lactamase [Aquimarina mytili]MBL0682584.1 subclass B1 metallo-beta-lactamase [Aquimarina mytili]
MSKNIKPNPKVFNKKARILLISIIAFLYISTYKIIAQETITISENLKITRISDHSYIHVSSITLESGSIYPCNGFIYLNSNEAYVFDTPANDIATAELIDWLQNDQKITIKGVIFNHFHRDCNEGINVFKDKRIPTIASKKTAKLMKEKKYQEPDSLFKDSLTLTLGNKSIVNAFFGEAHTSDNIISYFPAEQLIYGGCMIKSLNASKGNLADANPSEWSNTVSKIKKTYPSVNIVIPGHGDYGDKALLDYTISLFKTEE